MQDNKNLQPFDSDILQCKADILKALGGASGKPVKEAPVQPGVQAGRTGPDPVDDAIDDTVIADDLLKTELNVDETATQPAPSSNATPVTGPKTVHIPSFESLPKRPLPFMEDDMAAPTESPAEAEPNGASVQESGEFTIADDDLLDLSNVDSEEVHAENGVLKTTLEQVQKHHARERQEKEEAFGRLRALSESIEPLRVANEQLKQQLNELTSQGQDALRESNEIHHGLVRSLEQEKASHASARAGLNALQSELQKVQKARDFLSESFSAVSEQNQRLQSELEILKQQQANVATTSGQQMAQLQRQKQELEQNLNDAQITMAHLNEVIANAHGRNQELLTHRDELRQQLETANARFAKAEQSLADLQHQKQKDTAETARIEEQLGQFQMLQKELQSVVSHNQRLRQELSETEAALSQNQSKIRTLESQVRQATEEKDLALKQAEQLKRRSQQLQTGEEARTQEMETLQTTYLKYRRQAEEEIEELNQKLQSLSGHIHILQQHACTSGAEIEDLKQRLRLSTESAEAAMRQFEMARSREQTLKVNLTELEKKLLLQEAAYTDSLKAAEAQKEVLERQRQQMLAEQHEVQKKIEHLQLELRLRDEAEQAAAAPEQPTDKRLENILEPEELSALMADPQDEEEGASEETAAGSEFSEDGEEALEDAQSVQETVAEKPALNLADLILSEQRRLISSRRQRVNASANESTERGIRQVVGQYIQTTATAKSSEKAAAAGARSIRMWDDDFLTPFQRELLNEIIQKEIETLGQSRAARPA